MQDELKKKYNEKLEEAISNQPKISAEEFMKKIDSFPKGPTPLEKEFIKDKALLRKKFALQKKLHEERMKQYSNKPSGKEEQED